MKVWTVIEILNWTIDFFKKKKIANPRFDAEFLISYALGVNRLELYLKFDMPVGKSERERIKSLILQRAKKKPLQYIVGETEFYGYKIYLNKFVLIPRPETEFLVEQIIKEKHKNDILEIGTGSGAIAIALSKLLPDSVIYATDISKNALEVAKKNIHYHKIENIKLIYSDLFDNIKGKYDIIVSNPPYISERDYQELDAEIKNYEPKIALIAKENGLFFYKRIIKSAKDFLKEKGKIYLEIGYNQAEEIEKFAKNCGFNNIVSKKDYNGFDRYMVIN